MSDEERPSRRRFAQSSEASGLISPPTTVAPTIATAGTDPRRRGMNVSSSGLNPSNKSFTIYKYRAGVPALLPLPLETEHIGRGSEALMNELNENDDYFRSVLDEAGIDYDDIHYVYRHVEDRSPNYHDATVLVEATWNDESDPAWLDAAHQIKARLDDIDREDVRVEFIARQLTLPKYTAPLQPEHPFNNLWNDTIGTEVCRMLEEVNGSVLKGKVSMVTVLRLGYSMAVEVNPITILVSMRYTSYPFEWVIPQHEIEQYIATVCPDFDICTHFENAEVENFPGDNLSAYESSSDDSSNEDITPFRNEKLSIKEHWDTALELFKKSWKDNPSIRATKGGILKSFEMEEIRPGSSIGGVHLLRDVDRELGVGGQGTMGPIVEIVDDKGARVGVFGLSNWHVVRAWIDGCQIAGIDVRLDPLKKDYTGTAKAGSLLDKMDKLSTGFGPKGSRELKGVEWPQKDRYIASPAWKTLARTLMTHQDSADFHQKQLQENAESTAENVHTKKKLDIALANVTEIEKFALVNDPVGWTWAGSSPVIRLPGKTTRVDLIMIKLDDEGSRVPLNKISNKLPAVKDYPEEMQELVPESIDELQGVGPLLASEILFKMGARTGATSGQYSRTRPRVFLETDGDTKPGSQNEFAVHAVIGKSPKLDKDALFSNSGDSGAAVWNRKGMLVAQIWGGCKVHNAAPLTLVQPAEDVFGYMDMVFERERKKYTVRLYKHTPSETDNPGALESMSSLSLQE